METGQIRLILTSRHFKVGNISLRGLTQFLNRSMLLSCLAVDQLNGCVPQLLNCHQQTGPAARATHPGDGDSECTFARNDSRWVVYPAWPGTSFRATLRLPVPFKRSHMRCHCRSLNGVRADKYFLTGSRALPAKSPFSINLLLGVRRMAKHRCYLGIAKAIGLCITGKLVAT